MAYRSIPLHLTTSDAFQALSPEQKGVLLTLLLHCPYTGLGRFLPGVLEIYANTSSERLAAILHELERADWIVRDGAAIFICDLLSWQSNYSPSNVNHRRNVQRSIDEVRSPKLVAAFLARYPEWVPEFGRPQQAPSVVSSESHSEPIGKRPVMGSASGRDPGVVPSRRHSDQEPAPLAENRVQEQSEQHSPAPSTATAYAHALAKAIEEAQVGAGRVGDSPRVKADAKAAAALLADNIPLSFASAVAADVAANYRPTSESPRIASTRYVTAAVIDAWKYRANESGPSPSRPRRHADARERDDRDRARNLDPRVQAAVKAEIERLNAAEPHSGDAWFESMKALAARDGGWAVPTAFDWLKQRTSATLNGSGNGRATR